MNALLLHDTSVRALQDTTCLAIWRADFESYIRQFPDVAAKVESTLIARFAAGQDPEELLEAAFA